ncbi:MAG: hypothetical protein GC185_04580 [Alphaproteobacteria bacterium]|nr:hypothetical protein [Alphaproteobacteria bacterium]
MTDAVKKPENEKTGRLRSPPAPFISLPKAIERAKSLHATAQHHPVGIAVLANAWGYSAKSSGLLQTAAALLQFGLLNDEGSGDKRKFQLTNDALRIVQDADPASEKRKEALSRTALFPKIHKELWEKYGASAGEVVLKNYLTLDRREAGESPFSEVAADALISEYKETITYADLENNTSQSPPEKDIKEVAAKSDNVTHFNPPLSTAAQAGQKGKTMAGERVLQDGILSQGATYRIIVSGKIGPKEIDRLIKKLELDKEILADQEDDDYSDLV